MAGPGRVSTWMGDRPGTLGVAGLAFCSSAPFPLPNILYFDFNFREDSGVNSKKNHRRHVCFIFEKFWGFADES